LSTSHPRQRAGRLVEREGDVRAVEIGEKFSVLARGATSGGVVSGGRRGCAACSYE
jgi:hypothetical protein